MVNSIDSSNFNAWFESMETGSKQFKAEEIGGINSFANQVKQDHEDAKKENDEIQNS